MIESSAATSNACYELRFTDLNARGHGFAFPCDEQGHVDIDGLSERGRNNYLFARALVGIEMSAPVVLLIR